MASIFPLGKIAFVLFCTGFFLQSLLIVFLPMLLDSTDYYYLPRGVVGLILAVVTISVLCFRMQNELKWYDYELMLFVCIYCGFLVFHSIKNDETKSKRGH